jgi:hypothetical protein
MVDVPAGKGHPMPARARKANRLIGLRLDYLVRLLPNLAPELGFGYVFAEFSPGSGVFLTLASGPPMWVLQRSHVAADGIGVFATAADITDEPAVDLAKVDAVLAGIRRSPASAVTDRFGAA